MSDNQMKKPPITMHEFTRIELGISEEEMAKSFVRHPFLDRWVEKPKARDER